MGLALRILKSYEVELEESPTGHPVQPAHLEERKTKVTFLLDIVNQKTSLDLFFSFLLLIIALCP